MRSVVLQRHANGIDLGGTKIEGIAIDESGVERQRLRVPTPKGNYAAVIDAIASLVAKIEKDKRREGHGGRWHPRGDFARYWARQERHTIELIGHPLDKDLGQALGREVRVANDANCFALSEATDGAGANCSVVFGVIVGTGTGGASSWMDTSSLDHMPSRANGATTLCLGARDDERPGHGCFCGRPSCIESFLAGPSLSRDHREHTGQGSQGTRSSGAGRVWRRWSDGDHGPL